MPYLKFVCYLMLYAWAQAIAPARPFACISYMEDEKFIQDDDDFEDYPSSGMQTQYSAENLNSLDVEAVSTKQAAVPLRRQCQADYTFCFALWRQTRNGSLIEKQGCWKESTERNATCSHTECTSSAPTSRNNTLYYCCCSGDSCNRNVTVVEPAPLELLKPVYGLEKEASLRFIDARLGVVLSAILVLTICLSVSGFAAYLYIRKVKDRSKPEQAPLAPSGPGYSSNLRNVDNINLICMLGNGKYGTVMKGLLHDQEVAVKIFPESHYPYYINERNIYSLPMMDSPSLLTYFGFDERLTMDGKIEYQLVLSLAPLGCLQDWLIANTMGFETFCGMAKSITRGLSHLHTEIIRDDEYKPCIAHRDFNSRNVLVKANRTCCIADFGFALKVFGSKYEYRGEVAVAETKSINEVGTLRYMAPELLEGAVNLRDCETSLKQMDVYALGLVLWEVATRCSDFYPPAQMTPSYRAPYEQEVGTHPTFDQMQTLVVRHKARPLFPPGWGGGAAVRLIRETCEDCWDHDAEARLTSLCAEERMQEAAGLRPRYSHTQSPSALLNANNLLITDHLDASERKSNLHQKQISIETCNSETATMLQPPPNQKVLPRALSTESALSTAPYAEKNHLIQTQQQLQPYQGRNPCQERNLVPAAMCPTQILVEKSKKHSFQNGQENSFSCLEDDVSVEDLISGSISKIGNFMTETASSMGEGFPKQHNTDRKLRGWHGVRALIQKNLFRRSDAVVDEFHRQFGQFGDEKSNLVDNRYATSVKGLDNNSIERLKKDTVSYIDDCQGCNNGVPTTKTTMLNDVYSHTRRPNNLDFSPVNSTVITVDDNGVPPYIASSTKSNLIQSIAEENNDEEAKVQLQNLRTHSITPSKVGPQSLSTSPIKQINNNNNVINDQVDTFDTLNTANIVKEAITATASMCSDHLIAPMSKNADIQFRRQRSLEMFREVFSGRGSTEKLRDPSQRVKTPGDVPPSVRKVRTSKTFSLYDDRMMDSSTLNIL